MRGKIAIGFGLAGRQTLVWTLLFTSLHFIHDMQSRNNNTHAPRRTAIYFGFKAWWNWLSQEMATVRCGRAFLLEILVTSGNKAV